MSKYQTSNPVARWIIRRFLDQLCARVAALEPTAILDLGCGEGIVAQELTRLLPNTRYTGIDMSEEAIRTARELNPGVTFHQQSVLDVEPPTDGTDLVLCVEVLEHLERPDLAAARIAACTEDRAIVSVPWEPYFRLGNLLRGNYVSTWGNHPEHIQAFEPRSLRALLSPHFASVDAMFGMMRIRSIMSPSRLRRNLRGVVATRAGSSCDDSRPILSRPVAVARLALALSCCSGSVMGCDWIPGRDAPLSPPRAVVLISIDSLRPDHLGAYGYERNTSRGIDQLAADGVVFEDAMSTTSWTLPAHISMLTSLYPEVHGVVKNGLRLDERVVLISELLRPLGYRTAAFVSGPYLSRRFGYNQGFDHYDDKTIPLGRHRNSHRATTNKLLDERVVQWLDANNHQPFFLFVHYWDVHYHYDPPPPYDAQFGPDYVGEVDGANFTKIGSRMTPSDLEHVIALYDGEIAFTDSYIEKLLDLLRAYGIYDDALIVLTADHGEEFLEHGRTGHMKNLFQESIAVPLIIKFPSQRWSGKRFSAPVSIVDIVPTMLDYLGQPPHPEFDGQSLLPIIQEDAIQEERALFADLSNDVKAVRYGRHKFVTRWNHKKGGSGRLFDLAEDPSEKANQAQMDPQRAEVMSAKIADWMKAAARRAAKLGTSEFDYDPELDEQLRSLGYIE